MIETACFCTVRHVVHRSAHDQTSPSAPHRSWASHVFPAPVWLPGGPHPECSKSLADHASRMATAAKAGTGSPLSISTLETLRRFGKTQIKTKC